MAKIMTDAAIECLKTNIDLYIDHYIDHDDPLVWMPKALGMDNVFLEIPAGYLNISYPELNVPENGELYDVENIKALYTAMMNLSDTAACDERVWAGMAHTEYYDYMLKRFPVKDASDKDTLLNRYFFGQSSSARSTIYTHLSRMWWYGRLTYDKDEPDDPFWMLDYVSSDINGTLFRMFASTWPDSFRTRKLFFKSLKYFTEQTGVRVTRTQDLFTEAAKYMNILWGMYLVDACPDEFIIGKMYDHLVNYNEEQKNKMIYNESHNVYTAGPAKFNMLIDAVNRLGGVAVLNDIIDIYAKLAGRDEKSVGDYVRDTINENTFGSKTFTKQSKRMFYPVSIDGVIAIKLANKYLTTDNIDKRQCFIDHQIASRTDQEKFVFNIVSSQEGIYKLSDLMTEVNLQAAAKKCNDSVDAEKYIRDGHKTLCSKGLIERISAQEYAKAFIV